MKTTATRLTAGAISLSASNHLLPMLNSNRVEPVTRPPGRAKFVTKPLPTGSVTLHEHDRQRAAYGQQPGHHRCAHSDDQVGGEAHELGRLGVQPTGVRHPAVVQAKVAPFHPAELAQPSLERRHPRLRFRIVLRQCRQHPDAAHSRGLLRARSERPRNRAAKQGYELPSPHGIDPGGQVGLRELYQTSQQKCVTNVT